VGLSPSVKADPGYRCLIPQVGMHRLWVAAGTPSCVAVIQKVLAGEAAHRGVALQPRIYHRLRVDQLGDFGGHAVRSFVPLENSASNQGGSPPGPVSGLARMPAVGRRAFVSILLQATIWL
jgi:hypothetical protein